MHFWATGFQKTGKINLEKRGITDYRKGGIQNFAMIDQQRWSFRSVQFGQTEDEIENAKARNHASKKGRAIIDSALFYREDRLVVIF